MIYAPQRVGERRCAWVDTLLKTKKRQFGEFDVTDQFRGRIPDPALQILFGLFCTLISVAVRFGVDSIALSAGPFSLIYPAILISTLYGRWFAGLVTWFSAFLFAWYFVLPYSASFSFQLTSDAARTAVNGASGLVILLFAEIFRAAVRRAVAERDAVIVSRELLLREVDHRMKNNFAIVASLLNLQLGRIDDDRIREALAAAASRVRSFAAAHEYLYQQSSDLRLVNMREYLSRLLVDLEAAMLDGRKIKMVSEIADLELPRDSAVGVGLIVNELVTNAVKHAFHHEQGGEIRVIFQSQPPGWRLVVEDTGRGLPTTEVSDGLGSRLTESFAHMAGGVLERAQNPSGGARFTVTADAISA